VAYEVKHTTKYVYETPVRETVMEVRMQPRTESLPMHQQRCMSFGLATSPRANLIPQTDYLGNTIHVFTLPGTHNSLTITARSVVEIIAPELPPCLPESAWEKLDRFAEQPELWDLLTPSKFTEPTELSDALMIDLKAYRRADPLTMLRDINTGMYRIFDYDPSATEVDSSIDVALSKRKGVCQDFAHIMLTIVRRMGIPCRYVSGYLFTRRERSAADASHAWVEVWLPELGWVGFDPTNDRIAGERHIRVAVGRDYSDVPPTRGVYKGKTKTRLDVGVQIREAQLPAGDMEPLPEVNPVLYIGSYEDWEQEQQQQQ
jgi:transglutaminase-like putative cysteine protease